jgi:hypothetical protein
MYGRGGYGRLIYGAGPEILRAAAAQTLGDATQVATVTTEISGVAAQTLAAATQVATFVVTDDVPALYSAAQTLGDVTNNAQLAVVARGGASGAAKGARRKTGFEPIAKVYPPEPRPEPYRLPEPPSGWGRPPMVFNYPMLMPTDLAPANALRISVLEIEQQIQDAIDIHALEEFLDRQGL